MKGKLVCSVMILALKRRQLTSKLLRPGEVLGWAGLYGTLPETMIALHRSCLSKHTGSFEFLN